MTMLVLATIRTDAHFLSSQVGIKSIKDRLFARIVRQNLSNSASEAVLEETGVGERGETVVKVVATAKD